MALLDDLVHKLQDIGLQLNKGKTVVLTSKKIQPPSFLHTHNGSKLRVLQQQEAHKWLGCMISAAGSKNTVSQSVSQACTPRGEPFQGAGAKFHFIHTLHAHWLQKSKKPFNCCFHTTKSCAVSSQRPNLW